MKHPKTHINRSNKVQAQRANIKSIKGKETHKWIPIRVTADLSMETLQARRKWHDLLEVMKEKKLQPRLLYLARISFKYEGEIKRFRQAKAERIHHHQTSSSTNAKGSSLDRKHRKHV